MPRCIDTHQFTDIPGLELTGGAPLAWDTVSVEMLNTDLGTATVAFAAAGSSKTGGLHSCPGIQAGLQGPTPPRSTGKGPMVIEACRVGSTSASELQVMGADKACCAG